MKLVDGGIADDSNSAIKWATEEVDFSKGSFAGLLDERALWQRVFACL